MRVKDKPVPAAVVPTDLTALDPRELVKASRQLERSLQRRRRISRQLAAVELEIRRQRHFLVGLMGTAPAAQIYRPAVVAGSSNGTLDLDRAFRLAERDPQKRRRGRPRIIRHTTPART